MPKSILTIIKLLQATFLSLFLIVAFTGCSEDDDDETESDKSVDYYYFGIEYYNNGEYSKAIDEFNEAIYINPNVPEYFYERGKSYYKLENYTKAIPDFTKAISLDYEYINSSYRYRAWSYIKIEQYAKAISDGNYLIKSSDNYAQARGYFINGYAYTDMKEYEKSLEYYNKSKELLNDSFVNNNIGYIYLQTYQYKKAINYFDEAISLETSFDNSCNPYGNLGLSYYHLGNFQKSVFNYNLAENNCDDKLDKYDLTFLRANSYIELEQYENALYDAENLQSLYTDKSYPYFITGLVAFKQGDYETALFDLTESIKDDETQRAYKYRFLTNKKLGNEEDANSDFEKYLELYNEVEDKTELDHFYLAELYVFAENFEKASEYINKAENMLNENYFAIKLKEQIDGNLTNTTEQNNENSDTTTTNQNDNTNIFETTEQNNNDDNNENSEVDPNIDYYTEAKKLYSQEKYSEAITSFSKAITSNSNDEWSYFWRGMSYFWLNKFSEAVTDLEKAVSINSNVEQFYNALAVSYYSKKDYTNSIKNFELAKNFNSQNDIYAYSIGLSNYNLKKYSDAISNFSDAIDLEDQKENYYYLRAVSNYKLTNYDPAISDLRKYLEIKPDDQRIKDLRTQIELLTLNNEPNIDGENETETNINGIISQITNTISIAGDNNGNITIIVNN
jgi:tetratricopeptide (TPR) repeat protein